MSQKSIDKKLFGIQVLRGLAASMVIYVHALSNYKEKIDFTFIPTMGFDLGELGVKLFFCISGFIIFTTSRNFEPGFGSIKLFFSKRLLRIVPIYWIFTIIYYFKLSLQSSPPLFSDLLKSLLFIPYSADGFLMRPVIGQGWTLNYEMFFYLLFGIALYFNKFWRLILITLTLLGLIVFNHFGYFHSDDSLISACLYFLSGFYLIYFLIGVLIGVLFDKSILSMCVNDKGKIFSFILLLLTYIGLHSIFNSSDLIKELIMLGFCLFCVSISVSNKGNVEAGEPKSIRPKLFSLLEALGNASYSTYLTHGFVLGLFVKFFSKFDLRYPIQFALFMILVCSFIGLLVYSFIESPLLKYLNSKINQKVR